MTPGSWSFERVHTPEGKRTRRVASSLVGPSSEAMAPLPPRRPALGAGLGGLEVGGAKQLVVMSQHINVTQTLHGLPYMPPH